MPNFYQKIFNRLKAPGSTLRKWKDIRHRGVSHVKNDYRRYIGQKRGDLIRMFWWEDYPNFGDDLNRILAKYFGYTPLKVLPNEADLVMLGSILDLVPENYTGTILGSGFRSGGPKKLMADAKILALRGYLTAERLSISDEFPVLGDPGLLVSRFAQRQSPRYEIGLVPHFTDLNSPSFKLLERRFGKKCRIINPRQTGNKVVRQISECSSIFSSSLHGLITADALGIPSRWIHFSEREIPSFKFHDYYSAFDETRTPIQIDGNESIQALIGTAIPPPLRVEEVKMQLDKCVDGFMASFRSSRLPEK